MTVKLIVAVDQGNAIGWTSGFLPWKLKADMRRFKELTTGHTVFMGFNTFKSLNMKDGLPDRKNIVLTRKHPKELFGQVGHDIDIVSDVSYIDRYIKYRSQATQRDHIVWVIGGATVYDEVLAMGMVDQIYLTLVHTSSGADVRLKTDLAAWKRFILTERKRGKTWEPIIGTRQWDGEVETSYLTLLKV